MLIPLAVAIPTFALPEEQAAQAAKMCQVFLEQTVTAYDGLTPSTIEDDDKCRVIGASFPIPDDEAFATLTNFFKVWRAEEPPESLKDYWFRGSVHLALITTDHTETEVKSIKAYDKVYPVGELELAGVRDLTKQDPQTATLRLKARQIGTEADVTWLMFAQQFLLQRKDK